MAVIDLQENFLKSIPSANHLVNRAKFLLLAAMELGVPACGTEQYPERMGETISELTPLIPEGCFSKMSFSACGCQEFNHMVKALGRKRMILVGVETHICITSTALDLIENGYEVTLALDAIGSRLEEANQIAIQRLVEAGCTVAHTESIVYEWMKTATHPQFKTVLQFVKDSANKK